MLPLAIKKKTLWNISHLHLHLSTEMNAPFRFILLYLFTSISYAFILPTSRQQEHHDICNKFKYETQGSLCGNQILHDGRSLRRSYLLGQCRMACSELVEGVTNSRMLTGCTICQNASLLNLNPFIYQLGAICIPRHVCIENCGPEKPGCVYTGSCFSQNCFKSSVNNKSVNITRYTHRGPGSQFQVQLPNGTLITGTSSGYKGLSDMISDGYDVCGVRDASFSISTYSGRSDYSPITDACLNGGRDHCQCRVANTDFGISDLEVVQIPTNCDFCNTAKAEKWFNEIPFGAVKSICIPRQTCIDNCGPEGYGCVYTGSCRSRLCYSSIESKKPLLFSFPNETGFSSTVLMDKSGAPIDQDPPVFSSLGKEGSATDAVEGFNFAEAIQLATPDPEYNAVDNNKNRKFLVPILSVSGGLFAIAIVVILFFFIRRLNDNRLFKELISTDGEIKSTKGT